MEEAWIFNLRVSAADGRPLPRREAEEIFKHLIAWAESHNLQAGGGPHGASEEDSEWSRLVSRYLDDPGLCTGEGLQTLHEALRRHQAMEGSRPRNDTTWVLAFGLESESADPLPESAAQDLMDHLHAWVAKRGFQVEGGFKGDSDAGISKGTEWS